MPETTFDDHEGYRLFILLRAGGVEEISDTIFSFIFGAAKSKKFIFSLMSRENIR